LRLGRRITDCLALALLLVAIATQDALATFPGHNGRIAFVSGGVRTCEDCNPNDPEKLWSVKPRARQQLLARGQPGDPAYSPDGRKLAVSVSGQIRILSGRRPAQRLGAGEKPTWSPDGSQLAFVAEGEGERSLAVMRADGTDRRLLVRGVDPTSLAWSPDGQALAFSDGSEYENVFVIQADGTGLQRIAAGGSSSAARPREAHIPKVGVPGRGPPEGVRGPSPPRRGICIPARRREGLAVRTLRA
jgi:Tol biopolymer transport system component